MGKSNIVREFELIATRIYNQKMRENQFLVRLGTWVKVLQDENREMKRQIAELEIRLKKLNDYGPTLLTRSEANQQEEISPNQRITPGASACGILRKIRKPQGADYWLRGA